MGKSRIGVALPVLSARSGTKRVVFTQSEVRPMVCPRRCDRQIFYLKKVTIDRTNVIRLENGALVYETRPTLAISVSPSPTRSVDRYQYVPTTPDDAYAETAAHLYEWYGILTCRVRVAQP